MKFNKWFVLFGGLVLLSMALAACGSSPSQPFPTGTFVDTQNNMRGYIFGDDGTFKYFTLGTGTITATGTYTIEGNRWIDPGSNDCAEGIYEWSYDGTTLSFKVVGKDDCDARKASLDGHSFILKQ